MIKIAEEKKYTKKQKEKLLLMHGWDKLVGYAMDYEAPESAQCIVTLEEIKSKIGMPAEEFYFPKNDPEVCRDIEDAWECLIDDLYEQNDLSSDEDLYNILDDKLQFS